MSPGTIVAEAQIEVPSTSPSARPLNVGSENRASPASSPDPSHEEHQYLNLIRKILEGGEHRPDRYACPGRKDVQC